MKIIRIFIILIIIFLIFIPACNKNPIPSVRIDSFSEVKTIGVSVNQSYIDGKTGNKIVDFSMPIKGDCKMILENMGFRAVDQSDHKYDAKLEINIIGRALYQSYLGMEGSPLLYTGAELEGNILLSVDTIEKVERKFSEKIEPPEVITIMIESEYERPSDAPFASVGGQKHLFLLLYEIWGMEALLGSLDSEDQFIVKQAMWGLVELKDPSSTDILINLLNDKEENIKRAAIDALARKGGTEVVDPLTDMLEDSSLFVRKDAAEALGRIGSPSAVSTLIECLEYDEDELVSRTAAKALGNIGDTSSIEALEEASEKDQDEYVREAIEKILERNS